MNRLPEGIKGDPSLMMWKELCRSGIYETDGNQHNIDRAFLQNIVTTFFERKRKGIEVPCPVGHTHDPEAKRGRVVYVELREGKGSVSLYGIIEFVSDEAKEKLENSGVSIEAPEVVTDGDGEEESLESASGWIWRIVSHKNLLFLIIFLVRTILSVDILLFPWHNRRKINWGFSTNCGRSVSSFVFLRKVVNMNQKQRHAALQSMISWLSHPAELGAPPAEIECAGEFDLHELHYYMFRYKLPVDLEGGSDNQWRLGVCGGYEPNELDNCGHTLSQMQPYSEDSAEADAIEMVETVRSYWMNKAKSCQNLSNQDEESDESDCDRQGTFLSLVLLEKPQWDKVALQLRLAQMWKIDAQEEELEPEIAELQDKRDLIFSYEGGTVVVGFMPTPIPDNSAEVGAERNFLWKDAVETVKRHQAHLIVTILGNDISPVEAGILIVKITAACCKQSGVLGVLANSVVYEPDYYVEFSSVINDDMFPVYNLVWFDLFSDEKGISVSTFGLANFGHEEIEVIDSQAEPSELIEFLADISCYIITEDVDLQDGETIGFSEEQKLPITRSKAVFTEGETIKIEFNG